MRFKPEKRLQLMLVLFSNEIESDEFFSGIGHKESNSFAYRGKKDVNIEKWPWMQ